MGKKELIFQFFKDNPEVLNEIDETEKYKLLGIKPATYKKHLLEYKSICEANRIIELKAVNRDKYFKNRLREKFVFDDSKLFGY